MHPVEIENIVTERSHHKLGNKWICLIIFCHEQMQHHGGVVANEAKLDHSPSHNDEKLDLGFIEILNELLKSHEWSGGVWFGLITGCYCYQRCLGWWGGGGLGLEWVFPHGVMLHAEGLLWNNSVIINHHKSLIDHHGS